MREIENAASRLLNYFEGVGEAEEADAVYPGDPAEDMRLVWDTLSGVGLLPERPSLSTSGVSDTLDTDAAHQ